MYRARDKIDHLLGHVTLTYKVTRQEHVSNLHVVDFLDPTNRGNKKNHVSSMHRARDKMGHLQGHVTLTYKVTRQGHLSGLHVIDFIDLTNHVNNVWGPR